MKVDNDSDTKYKLAPINLDKPKNSHDFQILFTGTKKKVLEIGTASGYITKILTEQGCQVTAVEIDPESSKEAEKFAEKVIVKDVEEVDFDNELGSEKFDVVLMGDVLEHLKKPEEVLKKLHSRIKDSGYIVCSIPNIAYGSIRLKLLNGNFSYEDVGLLDKTHLKFFTLLSIVKLMNETSFTITKIQRIIEPIRYNEDVELSSYKIPLELKEAIKNDTEFQTFQFVFIAKSSSKINPDEKIEFKEDAKHVTDTLTTFFEEKKAVISKLEKIKKGHEDEIKEKDMKINELNNQLEQIFNSHTWKFLRRLDKLKK